MANNYKTGKGAKISIAATEIADCKMIAPPKNIMERLDASHLGTTGTHTEELTTDLQQGEQFSFQCPASTALPAALTADLTKDVPQAVIITLPAVGKTLTGTALLVSEGVDQVEINKIATKTVTMKAKSVFVTAAIAG